MNGTAVLEEPAVRQDNSGLVEAIRRSNKEIERRGRLLLSNGNDLTDLDLMGYCSLASDLGYREMERIGREILRQGGTFPAAKISALIPQEDGYMLRIIENKTGKEFTLPCSNPLKQYIGNPIDLSNPNALQAYRGKDVTIDVLSRNFGYEVVMIGLSKDVLSDASQATRLDLLN